MPLNKCECFDVNLENFGGATNYLMKTECTKIKNSWKKKQFVDGSVNTCAPNNGSPQWVSWHG